MSDTETNAIAEFLPSPVRGIVLKIASVFVFTAMALIIKVTASEVPVGEAVFFRSLFGIPPIVVWLLWMGGFPSRIATNNPMGHFWRGLAGISGMALGFSALGLLPYPEVVAIGYAAPVFATVLAAMFLGEKVRMFRLGAIATGLLGVLIVLYPKMTVLGENEATAIAAVGAIMALSAAMFAAIAQVFIRQLVQIESAAAIVFWFHVTGSALALLTLFFGWVWPAPGTALLLVLAGILGGIGQVLLTESYRHAETAVIASFEYVSMILAIVAGYFLFSEVLTPVMFAGVALIVGAGLFIIYRESRLGLERGRARRVMTPQG